MARRPAIKDLQASESCTRAMEPRVTCPAQIETVRRNIGPSMFDILLVMELFARKTTWAQMWTGVERAFAGAAGPLSDQTLSGG